MKWILLSLLLASCDRSQESKPPPTAPQIVEVEVDTIYIHECPELPAEGSVDVAVSDGLDIELVFVEEFSDEQKADIRAACTAFVCLTELAVLDFDPKEEEQQEETTKAASDSLQTVIPSQVERKKMTVSKAVQDLERELSDPQKALKKERKVSKGARTKLKAARAEIKRLQELVGKKAA